MNFFRRIKQSLVGAPLILFVAGLPFFGIGAGLTYQQILFRQNSFQAPGEVVSLSENCDDDGCAFSPVVRFTTLEGATVYYHSSYASSPPEYHVGERVAVLFRPENPEKAMIEGEGSVLRYVFMGAGGMIILSGLIVFGFSLKNSYLAEG